VIPVSFFSFFFFPFLFLLIFSFFSHLLFSFLFFSSGKMKLRTDLISYLASIGTVTNQGFLTLTQFKKKKKSNIQSLDKIDMAMMFRHNNRRSTARRTGLLLTLSEDPGPEQEQALAPLLAIEGPPFSHMSPADRKRNRPQSPRSFLDLEILSSSTSDDDVDEKRL